MARTVKQYRIDFKFNGMTVRKFTNDIGDAFKQVEPVMLHTDMFVTVQAGTNLVERHLLLTKARNVFRNDFDRQVFINNLLV